MNESYRTMIRDRSQPLEPIATTVEPKLKKLSGIRAVLFDIYGTLLISGCGDIGAIQTTDHHERSAAFVEVLAENGVVFVEGCEDDCVQVLFDEIAADHRRAQRNGIEYPEVDITDVWRRTHARLVEAGLAIFPTPLDCRRIALAYELRTNPVWSMRHAPECLTELYRHGMLLGFVSNAQFSTIELWKTLLQTDTTEFLIDEELQFYSFRYGHAKPGLKLYELAEDALLRRGISAINVLYIGNDMLNDMMPAQKIGFRTALFAGDSRSLRTREGDPRVGDIQPDIVLTDLSDLPKCIDFK